MAELLVRVRDKFEHNPWMFGEHEVVVVCADDWPWSETERASPDHRIVALPGVSKVDARRFAGPEVMHDPDWDVSGRRRQMKLDPAKFSAEFAEWYADDSRKQPLLVVAEDKFAGWFRIRVPLPRRDVIGARPLLVIG
jgi:hypothetical protein